MPVHSGGRVQEDGGLRAVQDKMKKDPITTNKTKVVLYKHNSS
jgi:hypothetical protein